MVRRLRRLGDRVFGPSVEPGGPGAGVQLWWAVGAAAVGARSVVAASAVLEVLEPPSVGRRYSWGVQAGVVDSVGSRVSSVVDSIVWSEAGSWSRPPDGSTWSLDVSCPPDAAALVDPAVWMELATPPDDPPVVVRWSALRCRSADSTARVDGVQVTFPTGPDWRRLDVVVDEVGVLMVTNTRRTARNLSVLALPADR